MRVKSSVRNICQHNYYCKQHCHFVNSTQISDVIKRLRLGKLDGVDDYTQTIYVFCAVFVSTHDVMA